MDGQRVREWESQCIEEQAPACTSLCPAHVDVRGMIDHLRKDNFEAAFKLFAAVIPFPATIGHICDHPCESGCKRAEVGDAIRINALERSSVAFGYKPTPFRIQKAQKKKRIAIVGAGLSGLTAAADLAVKGHSVVVFESQTVAFARLRELPTDRLPQDAIQKDLERFATCGAELRTSTEVALTEGEICVARLAEEFDAVFLGLGPRSVLALGSLLKLESDGRIVIDPLTCATSHPKIFAGGSHRYARTSPDADSIATSATYSPITSMMDGRCAAASIDRFLQGASLSANRINQGPYPSRLYTNTATYPPLHAIEPTANAGYTQSEAKAEAERCFPCHCLECVKVCPYLEHYGAYPKRYIREIYNNDTIVMGQHKSNRMIDSCMLCGLCEAVCPEHLSMADVCLDARNSMVAKGKMPVSHHEFALRDMAFSTSDAFAMTRHQPGFQTSSYLFFPGCQLSASSPDHVQAVYAHLCAKLGDCNGDGVGLMLNCCGAPAHWAGQQALFDSTLHTLQTDWERMGRPTLITACSTCYRMFQDFLPELPTQSLWEILEHTGLPDAAHKPESLILNLALHDPCTTRHNEGIQRSIRNLLAGLGISAGELNEAGQTTCCGYGGLASFANPKVTDKVIDQRINQSEADYLTYCAMCRDNFARRGKRSVHLLDLLLGVAEDPASRGDPGFSRRQENRARLKRRLLRDIWEETMPDESPPLPIIVSDEVRADMERKFILMDDIRQVIQHAEKTGAKLLDRRSWRFIASFRPNTATYWVEYTVEDEGFVVHRAYSHRMQAG